MSPSRVAPLSVGHHQASDTRPQGNGYYGPTNVHGFCFSDKPWVFTVIRYRISTFNAWADSRFSSKCKSWSVQEASVCGCRAHSPISPLLTFSQIERCPASASATVEYRSVSYFILTPCVPSADSRKTILSNQSGGSISGML